MRSGKIFTQSSPDGSATWSEPRQLIVRGGDATRWALRIVYGENAGNVEGANPLPLPDGRLLMTMRLRADPGDGATLRSARLWTISADLGKSWAEPEILRYADGSQVPCPASLANLFLSSKTGKLYLIANILDESTWGCRPRSPLQIAEMDRETFRVMRDTVTVIDANAAGVEKGKEIDFSNWRWYEDRATKDVVLVMSGCPGDKGRSETCGVPPHSFRYDIDLS